MAQVKSVKKSHLEEKKEPYIRERSHTKWQKEQNH